MAIHTMAGRNHRLSGVTAACIFRHRRSLLGSAISIEAELRLRVKPRSCVVLASSGYLSARTVKIDDGEIPS